MQMSHSAEVKLTVYSLNISNAGLLQISQIDHTLLTPYIQYVPIITGL